MLSLTSSKLTGVFVVSSKVTYEALIGRLFFRVATMMIHFLSDVSPSIISFIQVLVLYQLNMLTLLLWACLHDNHYTNQYNFHIYLTAKAQKQTVDISFHPSYKLVLYNEHTSSDTTDIDSSLFPFEHISAYLAACLHNPAIAFLW